MKIARREHGREQQRRDPRRSGVDAGERERRAAGQERAGDGDVGRLPVRCHRSTASFQELGEWTFVVGHDERAEPAGARRDGGRLRRRSGP